MFKKLTGALSRKQDISLLVVGLDNSGKSSIIRAIRPTKVNHPSVCVLNSQCEMLIAREREKEKESRTLRRPQGANKQHDDTTPTVGFQVEEIAVNGVNFTCYDMSGQSRRSPCVRATPLMEM